MATENIEGTATDTQGNPLQDATIYVFLEQNTEPDGTEFTGVKTSTDSNGNFVLKDHPAADGTSQEWHVAGFYADGTGEYNALSKPSVKASVGPAIPDTQNLHARYDFSELSSGTTSNVSDLTGNGYDLTNGSFSGVNVSINGIQAGEFDGTSDVIASNTFTSLPQPYEIFMVIGLDTNNTTTFNYAFGAGSDNNNATDIAYRTDSSEWFGSAGNLINGSSDTTSKLLHFVVDGASSELLEDGVITATGDAGAETMDSVGLGGRFRKSDRYFPGKIGEAIIYQNRDDNRRSEVEASLAGKWGITI